LIVPRGGITAAITPAGVEPYTATSKEPGPQPPYGTASNRSSIVLCTNTSVVSKLDAFGFLITPIKK
jgi:hypothetical protein